MTPLRAPPPIPHIPYLYPMKRWYDAAHFLSCLSFGRVWNALLILVSYYFSRISGKPVIWGMPISITVEPTTACNLACPECPSGLKQFSRPTGNMKLNVFENLLDQIRHTTSYMIFYFQGEPFIHPSLLEMIKAASKKNIYTATSTNAHFINEAKAKAIVESGLSRLIISIDGSTQEVYEQYRVNGNLQKVLDGTKAMVKAKKEMKSSLPHIIFQCLVVKPNEHQIPEIKKLAKELGVDEVRFKTAQLYDFEHGNPLMPENPHYSRYKQKADGTFEIKNQLDNHCWKMWHSAVTTQDGAVVPCCFDKDAQHEMGHLSRQNFADIWHSPAYRNFRSRLLKSRKEIDICANCSEGTKVWS